MNSDCPDDRMGSSSRIVGIYSLTHPQPPSPLHTHHPAVPDLQRRGGAKPLRISLLLVAVPAPIVLAAVAVVPEMGPAHYYLGKGFSEPVQALFLKKAGQI